MLPKPTYTGGSPASRNASSSFGSGRSSGRIQAPVWTMSRSVSSFHGARSGSAASQGLVREDVVADVVDRGQADRRAAPVERLRVQRVDALRVLCPEHPVVGLAHGRLPAGPRRRREVPRRQPEDVEGREHVADAELLGDIPCSRRHQAGRDDCVTPLGRCGKCLEPRGDELRREPERGVRRRRLQPGRHGSRRWAERDERRAYAGEELRELLVRRRAHPDLCPELAQPEGEGREGLEVAPRAPRRQQDTHVVISQVGG